MNTSFAKQLIHWHLKHGRHDLPWQKNKTAYRVYVSEIMLQQTQVSTVIPYYERFMATFPSVKSLALAPLDEVLALWSGLGYYGRARRLHAAAQQVHQQCRGRFPKTMEGLMALPGIGPSTAAAVLSLTYNQSETILDGNVKRVLARYHAVPGPVESTSTRNILWEYAKKNTPKEDAQIYTQAIMDLGATCCTRTQPNCTVCPFQNNCQAYLLNSIDDFPERAPPKKKNPEHQWELIFLIHDNHILMQQRPLSGIWGGLWHPPQIEDGEGSLHDWLRLHGYTKKDLSKQIKEKSFRHLLSHKTLIMTPHIVLLSQAKKPKGHAWKWVSLPDWQEYGIAKPVERVIKQLLHQSINTRRPI